ncbi:MAG: response regulator [Candidatus Accumulibacter phosphatis]|mgnify:CR=1 FL=1|uniref:Response regulator n=1 Tax=Candidatus Accumulibacter phosphatis TaxID=327160 RepID=A0A6A7RTF8_9PROT|nr:response regulator [Candidatus Accumulibacter phosphatis]
MHGTTADTLRVLLVEDSPLLQEVLIEGLEEIDGVVVCAKATGEKEAIEQLTIQSVDLAIVDLELNQGSGLGVLRLLHETPERFGAPHAVVFSSYGHMAVKRCCAALGAAAFFDKAKGMDALIDYVKMLQPRT